MKKYNFIKKYYKPTTEIGKDLKNKMLRIVLEQGGEFSYITKKDVVSDIHYRTARS